MNSLFISQMKRLRPLGQLRNVVTHRASASDEYCVDLVKKHDYDSFLSGLLVPKESRAAYFAIRAFNVEIAMIKDQTNGNLLAGRIRFQWWRDLIDEIYNGGGGKSTSMIGKQPVAQALGIHVEKHSLSSRWFERSLDARQRDFSIEQPETMDELENYAEQGHSSILYLILESLGVKDEASEYACSHVGVSSGIVTTLRAFPYHAKQSQIYLPREMMQKHALQPNTVLKGPNTEADMKSLRDCVFDVASQAYGHLDKARGLQYSPRALPALMPAIRSAMYLETLRQLDFNPGHSDFLNQDSPLRYQLQLLYASLMKKI